MKQEELVMLTGFVKQQLEILKEGEQNALFTLMLNMAKVVHVLIEEIFTVEW